MISRLLEVAGYYKPKKDEKTIVDISFNNTIDDATGNLVPVVSGYPGGIPVFEQQADGKGALRVNANQGIIYTVGVGKPRMLSTPDWRFEFEAKMVNPLLFKHESLVVFRKAPWSATSYNFHIWKRAQTNNQVIIAGDLWKVETSPMFTDPTIFPTNAWRKYAVEHTAVDNTTRFYVDGVLRGSRVSTSDVSSDTFEVVNGAPPNFFNGWIRNVKVFREL